METIASYQSRVFLGEHPVITERILLHSTGTEELLLAGSVIGVGFAVEGDTESANYDGKQTLFGTYAHMEPLGILQADVTVPDTGDAFGVCYVHCAALSDGLIWAEGTSAATQQTTITALRKLGIYVE